MARSNLVVVLVTASSAAEGEKISKGVLAARLAACVNLVPAVRSRYWWKGKIESAEEVLLIIKTRAALVERLAAEVKRLHTYIIPEVIALPVGAGNPGYLEWVDEETRVPRR